MTGCRAWKGLPDRMGGQLESLLQLAGHLQGRTLPEWNLLKDDEKDSTEKAIEAQWNQLEEVLEYNILFP